MKPGAARLLQTINDSLRAEFGNRTVHEVVSRRARQDHGEARQKDDAETIGVEVLDVRLKRVDLPQEVRAPVYRRMEAERKRVANELRSHGGAESEKIRADADRQREVILAEAYREAQRIKGEGDAKASAITRRLRTEPGVLCFLPQPRSVQGDLQEQERSPGAGPEFGILQVPEAAGWAAGLAAKQVTPAAGDADGGSVPRGVRADAGARGLLPFLVPRCGARRSAD